LHHLSPRADQPFVAVNCGAIPDALLESELFGHVRGAFTGAHADKEGLFAAADGGTLLLDEIGELSPAMQVKLLRVLQERKVKKVGGVSEEEVDVRVVTATNRDLDAEVERGAFRRDLFYRLNVIQVLLPPLRARRARAPPAATASPTTASISSAWSPTTNATSSRARWNAPAASARRLRSSSASRSDRYVTAWPSSASTATAPTATATTTRPP